MGFEIDKLSKEIQQKIKQVFFDDQPVNENLSGSLTDLESQNLTSGLNGETQEYITDSEAKALSENLSGGFIPISDSLEISQSDEIIQSINTDEKETNNDENIEFTILEQNEYQAMDSEQQSQFISGKLIDALKNNDFTKLIKFLNLYYSKECNLINSMITNSSEKESYLPIISCLNTNEIAELTTKLISSEGNIPVQNAIILSFINNIGERLKTISRNPNQIMLTMLSENANNNSDDSKINAKFKETIRRFFSNETDKLNNEIEALDFSNYTSLSEYFKTLPVKVFRQKIALIENLDDLKTVRNIIPNMPFSKADKQMLTNECAKKQGELQTKLPDSSLADVVKENEKIKKAENYNNERLKSKIEYELFKECKTPAQREMAKILIEDTRFHSSEQIIQSLKQIIKKTNSPEDVQNNLSFINIISQNNIFKDNAGCFNEKIIEVLSTLSADNIKNRTKLLDAYTRNAANFNTEEFIYFLKECNTSFAATVISAMISNKNIEKEALNHQSYQDFMGNVIDIIHACENGGINSGKNEKDLPNAASTVIKICEIMTNKNEEAQIQFYSKIINDDILRYDFNALKAMLKILAIKNKSDINFDLMNKIFELYKVKELESFDSEKLITTVDTLSNKKNFTSIIKDLLNNNEETKNKSYEHKIVDTMLKKDAEIYKEFTGNRAYTDEQLSTLFTQSQKEYGKNILNNLCKQREYTADDILLIMEHTPQHRVNLTKKIINTKYLTASQKAEVITKIDENAEMAQMIEKMLDKGELRLVELPTVLSPDYLKSISNKESNT